MKISQALKIISKLPVTEADAIDIYGLCQRVGGTSVRTMQRYMEQLSAPDSEHAVAPLVRRLDKVHSSASRSSKTASSTTGRAYLYCLDTTALRYWFMTDQMALNLILADQALGASLGVSERWGGKGLAVQAGEFVGKQAQGLRRVAAYVRIVPDGLGRMPARIEPAMVDCVLDAIARDRQVQFDYASARGTVGNWSASPRGLIAKDGTLYLIASTHLKDAPITFALHRCSSMQMLSAGIPPRHFSIDKFLEETQQLSHPIEVDDFLELKLRVAADTLYHFKERPFWQQVISVQPDSQGYWTVTAQMPWSIMLVPFVLSMSPGVEVIGPKQVRDEVINRLRESIASYNMRK